MCFVNQCKDTFQNLIKITRLLGSALEIVAIALSVPEKLYLEVNPKAFVKF